MNRTQQTPIQYLGLTAERADGGVRLEQASQLQGLQTLVALDEELAQYDRDLSGGTNA